MKSWHTTHVSLMLFLVFVAGATAKGLAPMPLQWTELPPLPPTWGHSTQPGLAGAFIGVDHDALIVAGGANFPDKPPWEGGKKTWWDAIFVLELTGERQGQWLTGPEFRLPRPLAYGASISLPEGIVCVGGCDAERCYPEAFLLRWDPSARRITTQALPALPRPLAFMGGAGVGRSVFVAGGQETMKDPGSSHAFYALNFARRDDPASFTWEALPAWSGPERILPVVAGRNDGQAESFYLFSGRVQKPGAVTRCLSDAYAYTLRTRQWKQLQDVQGSKRDGSDGVCVMAGTASMMDESTVLIFGGAPGSLFLELEQYDLKIAGLKRDAESAAMDRKAQLLSQADALLAARNRILVNHPGFSREIMAYDTKADSWSVAGNFPTGSHVTTTAVRWNNGVIIASGEIKPGIRTPRIWIGKLKGGD